MVAVDSERVKGIREPLQPAGKSGFPQYPNTSPYTRTQTHPAELVSDSSSLSQTPPKLQDREQGASALRDVNVCLPAFADTK